MRIRRLTAVTATAVVGIAAVSLAPARPAAAVVPNLRIAKIIVQEGNSGATKVSIPVVQSALSTLNTTVHFQTVQDTGSGAATAGSDYVAKSGNLTIPAGKTVNHIVITLKPDTVVENLEAFTVRLSAPLNATIATADGIVQLLDDDTAATSATVVMPSILVTPEGDTGQSLQLVTLNLNKPATETLKIHWTTLDVFGTNGAVSPTDYVATSGVVTFLSGQVTKTVTIPINGDTTHEGTTGGIPFPSVDHFGVQLSVVQGAVTLGTTLGSVGLGAVFLDDLND